MKDIEQSLDRAAVRQGWTFDDRWSRIGSPFVWIDGDQMPQGMFLEDVYAVLQYMGMYYERYDTVEAIRTDDHDAVRDDLRAQLQRLVSQFFPFLVADPRVAHNIECTALTRTQDYCAIRTLCPDLAAAPVQLDIGPGLGSHALYNHGHLGGRYIGLEASIHSYAIQRHVYRVLGAATGGYFDPVAMETLGAEEAEVYAEVASGRHGITHVPSWYAPAVPEASVDLVTATFVLNEIGPAGITWLLHHIDRTVRKGGFVYLRDSARRKPLRHNLDYDAALLELGFEAAGRLDVENRVDMFGIPRSYRRVADPKPGAFDELFDHFFSRWASTSHEGGYVQNVPGQALPG